MKYPLSRNTQTIQPHHVPSHCQSPVWIVPEVCISRIDQQRGLERDLILMHYGKYAIDCINCIPAKMMYQRSSLKVKWSVHSDQGLTFHSKNNRQALQRFLLKRNLTESDGGMPSPKIHLYITANRRTRFTEGILPVLYVRTGCSDNRAPTSFT